MYICIMYTYVYRLDPGHMHDKAMPHLGCVNEINVNVNIIDVFVWILCNIYVHIFMYNHVHKQSYHITIKTGTAFDACIKYILRQCLPHLAITVQ